MIATTKKIQLCVTCEEPTERCEDDAIYTEDGDGPLCLECWHKTPEYIQENSATAGSSLPTCWPL